MEEIERENNFIVWLSNEVVTQAPLGSYPNALKNFIPNKLEEMNENIYGNLFNCTDLEYLKILNQRLLNNGDLHEFNINTQNRLPSAAIAKYINFLENKSLKLEKTNTIKPTQKQALNQILYGSPGTGKTYNTINKAIEIIDSDFYQQNKYNREALKERFEEYKKAGQIEFITFHQSFSYEEFVEGIKAETSEANISYEVKSGVFKKLSNKSLQNFNQSNENIKNKKDFETVFKELILDKLKDDEKLEIRMKKSSFFIKEVDENKISFDKSGGESQHVLLIKNLKNMYEAEENKIIIGGLSQYYNPLLEYLLKNSEIKNTDKEPLKNYILIIDEINRGNISKIFGELITLIEPSKRIGADEEIRLKLPYSQELFGVPSNLYIIGTMNTADRSIALMDTALRRRFHFEEMMPNSKLLEGVEVDGIKIDKLLETINKRVEYLYDRDHTIGHAYFMSLENLETKEDKKAELENIFRNKIIPLLQEYFYDDWEKVRLVLGDGFVEKIELKSDIFDEELIKDSEYLEEEKFIYNIKKEFDFSKFKE
ncbi:McrB family protein [Aliarcobacter skirrowii]|uniref:McrB family protein n=1 Tax=Aliarcobacter skirrowii TaxID=28200 RepID=UPI000D613E2D|nr:AAA family ATPase [Aliarcobacter skirrowii]PWE21387.1 AAA family ATPase [Aliarcobacter skirrowii]PWE25533.1 AAA family ATPase [Aliarcobacter skirrowii]RJO56101.1 AAA family ATPase [Aliarcobacter skirrowii]RJO57901.1 AAA family ATPase [Aliarcobacter skirrowii]